jgi:SMODS-associated and fused to various effectors sensor domain
MKGNQQKSIKIRLSRKESPIVEVDSRQIDKATHTLLCVHAGGRCEFNGCNRYLMRHHVTKDSGIFGQRAHVVGFKESGPRGTDPVRKQLRNINDLSNLMLLCHSCHVLIDKKHPDRYPVDRLREEKRLHEERILRLTELDKNRQTAIIRLICRIAGEPVHISDSDVYDAVAPFHPIAVPGCVIDLTGDESTGLDFLESAKQTVDRRLGRFFDDSTPAKVSVLAIGPIPLLAYLGSKLSNKLDVQFYQLHRDEKSWKWNDEKPSAEFDLRVVKRSQRKSKVALILSLSGTIDLPAVKRALATQYTIYEVRLSNTSPNTRFLRTKADLDRFRAVYEGFLGQVLRDHGLIDVIEVFPAVPAPVASLLGHLPLKKVHPSLQFHDYNRAHGGFIKGLRIEKHDR